MKRSFILCFLFCFCLIFFTCSQENSCKEKKELSPKIELSKANKTFLKFASWNIRILSRKRTDDALRAIAKILKKYDFISILELRDEEVVQRLCRILKKDYGREYNYEISPSCGKKNQRTLLFFISCKKDLCGKNREKFILIQKDLFIREPYYATFRCENFDFTVIAIHILWGRRVTGRRREIVHLAKVFRKIQDEDKSENDVILAGDFNRPPKDDLAFGALNSISTMTLIFKSSSKKYGGRYKFI